MAREYDDQTRAAVMAALLAGQSVSKISDDHGVPRSTIYGWKDKILEHVGDDVAAAATEKKDRIGALLLQLVETELSSMITMSEVTARSEWILKQPASELAVFYGVRSDKLIRILDMFGATDSGGEGDE